MIVHGSTWVPFLFLAAALLVAGFEAFRAQSRVALALALFFAYAIAEMLMAGAPS